MNLRETKLNRRLTFTSNYILPISSKEGITNFATLMKMTWTNFDDFKTRYDLTVDTENFVTRMMYWQTCEALGLQLRRDLIDVETVYEMCGEHIIDVWFKFEPIIKEYMKRGQFGKDIFKNFEYLANHLADIKKERDPTYPINRNWSNVSEAISP
jgi:hypothetical protein